MTTIGDNVGDEQEPEIVAEEAAPEVSLAPVLGRLRDLVGDALLGTSDYRGDLSATVDSAATLQVMRWLKDEEHFDMLVDLTAVDYLGREPRFEVVYHVVSTDTSSRLRVKVPVSQEEAKVATVSEVWAGANWLEREAFDMYGIQFSGHPDLTRIYLYEEFEGHPLRKDYPKEKRQPLIGPGAIPRTEEAT